MVVFDLDPGEPATSSSAREWPSTIRDVLDALGLEGFPKTSGSKGLQVYVPLNTPGAPRARLRLRPRRCPAAGTAEARRGGVHHGQGAARTGKVFVDWSQNSRHKTTIAPYSLRARPRPTVSTPVTWDEVAAGGRGRAPAFEAADVLARLEEHGDLFAGTLTLRQRLPDPADLTPETPSRDSIELTIRTGDEPTVVDLTGEVAVFCRDGATAWSSSSCRTPPPA